MDARHILFAFRYLFMREEFGNYEKLLFLGASEYLIPVIKIAHDLGLSTNEREEGFISLKVEVLLDEANRTIDC